MYINNLRYEKKDTVNLLENEEKLSLLKDVNLMLTNKRLIYHNEFYASVYLNDVTLIKRQYHENTIPLLVALLLFVLGALFYFSSFAVFAFIIAAIVIIFCLVSYFTSRYSSLNIYCSGSTGIEVKLSGVSQTIVKNFTTKIETQMDRVKNNTQEPFDSK